MIGEFDYVVIGGGCIGASTAFHLAKRNAGTVALVEREKFLGTQSTAKAAGGVRAQFSTEVNTRLSLLSLDRFEKFEQETGHVLYFMQWGYLFLLTTAEQAAAFKRYREMWMRLGMKVEWLSPAEIATRFPYIETTGIVAGSFHQRDGFVDANDIVQGYAQAARKHGTREISECEVLDFKMSESNRTIVAVKTSKGEIGVKKGVVLATGAWSRALAQKLRVEVPVDPYRRQILVTKPFDGIKQPFPMTVDMGSGLYFHPESGGVLLGLADKAEPVSFNEAVNEPFNDVILGAALERAPVLESAAILRGWAGLYETTPDHHPVIDRLGHISNAWICAGFSGHGLMHAPAAGIVTSELVLDGRATSVDITRLSLNRFNNPEALQHEVNVI